MATAKPEHYAKDILDHFELTPYFDVIVGANYESGLLHKKEILEKALELCGNPLTDEMVIVWYSWLGIVSMM